MIKKDCYWYFSYDEYMYYKSCILYAVKTSYIAPLGAWGRAGNRALIIILGTFGIHLQY